MTVHDILSEAYQIFEAAGIPSARLDAEVLLSYALGRDKLEFLKNPSRTVDETHISFFRELVERRARWEPVAYITGRKNFWSFTLEVSRDVLIPRPDTEIIVEEALEVAKNYGSEIIKILDIGTGSGAIALALATEIPHAGIVATDISAEALALAEKNARVMQLENKISFRRGDLFEPVDGVFDIIVCNPPYISAQEYEELPAGVKDYEPRTALRAGEKGTEFYERLIGQGQNYLEKKGWLFMEIGAKQEEPVRRLAEESGCYDSIAMRRDYAGLPRVIRARRK